MGAESTTLSGPIAHKFNSVYTQIMRNNFNSTMMIHTSWSFIWNPNKFFAPTNNQSKTTNNSQQQQTKRKRNSTWLQTLASSEHLFLWTPKTVVHFVLCLDRISQVVTRTLPNCRLRAGRARLSSSPNYRIRISYSLVTSHFFATRKNRYPHLVIWSRTWSCGSRGTPPV